MRVLFKDSWKKGFLDEALTDNSVRIQVVEWTNLYKINDIYFIPKKSWCVISNYLKEIGIKAVANKIKSRLHEAVRNDKFFSYGRGVVCNSVSALFPVGTAVIFLAPCQPRCMERVVLDQSCVAIDSLPQGNNTSTGKVLFYRNLSQHNLAQDLANKCMAWSRFSGHSLPENIGELINHVNNKSVFFSERFVKLQWSPNKEICERTNKPSSFLTGHKRPCAAIFGYGQYTKTSIIPNIKKYLDLKCIHELDTTQIGCKPTSFIFDTAGDFRDFEHYDICFMAGYHHTHAPLAIKALNKGMAVVSEKPIVTEWYDLELLLEVLTKTNALFYCAFQKRYSIFNRAVYQDLNVRLGEAISYHCIVYETPLPDLHWYRWPNSNSRIISNACHWVDHFLFLNDFSAVAKKYLNLANNGDVSIFIELANGATFSMLLTELGSQRIGLQEYIELRTQSATVKIVNSSHYTAENSQKILRSLKINKLSVYGNMYKTIAENYVAKKGGDTVATIHASASLILSLEDAYKNLINNPIMS